MRRDKDRAPTKGQADNPIYIKYLRLEKLPCLRDKVSGFELTRGPGWQPNIAVDEPQPGQQSLRSPLLQQAHRLILLLVVQETSLMLLLVLLRNWQHSHKTQVSTLLTYSRIPVIRLLKQDHKQARHWLTQLAVQLQHWLTSRLLRVQD